MRTLLSCILFLCITNTYSQNEFITTWKTDNPGVSEDNQITIPTYKAPDFLPQVIYDYNVDWGDGNVSENVTGDITHTYATSGVYQVSINGLFPRILFENSTNSKDNRKIIEINQWGSNQWTSMSGAFSGCVNIDVKATDVPNFSNLNDISAMFKNCSSLIGNDTMANWDLSTVTQMSLLYFGATKFNQPIGNWDVSNVESMFSLFQWATSFNQNISDWDVSGVSNMGHMFFGTSFNKNIGSWNVSNVLYMNAMFSNNQVFNQDISGWDVSNVKWMTNMFTEASAFNQDLSSWNVESVEEMGSMFFSALSFNQNLGVWNIGNVNNMSFMLSNTGMSINNYDSTLIGWSNLPSLKNDVKLDSNIQFCESGINRQAIIEVYNWTINDDGLFPECTANQKRPFITTWQVEASTNNSITIPTFPGETYDYSIDWGDGNSQPNITNDITHQYDNPGNYKVTITGDFPRIYFELAGPNSALIVSVDQWGDINWSSMEGAFSNCVNLDVNAHDVPDLSLVTSAKQMFNNCQTLKGNSSFNNWDVSNLQDVAQMFSGTPLFNTILSSWDTLNMTTMFQMFYESGFNNSLGDWNISNVNSLSGIFEGSALSTVNYDNTLIGWSHLNTLQPNITFDAGTSQFCNATSARQSIIEGYNWIINDSGENCPTFRPFVTTWKTDNPGTSDNNTIALRTFGGPFNIDWGDGVVDMDVVGATQHTYSNPGIYTVSISGSLFSIRLQTFDGNDVGGDAPKLIEINQWGDISWNSMESAFKGCTNLDVVAGDTPDLSNLNSLFYMFEGCSSLTDNPSFNNWDISTIENLSQAFTNCTAFNADISDWDVGNVTTMGNLFSNCSEFNQDISGWNVSNVINMGSMFSHATKFNQPIGSWDVSNVTYMGIMFQSSGFNQDISSWDVSNVASMSSMFNFAPNFNQNIGDWNVSNVTDMSGMFSSTGSFNQNIGNWNVSKVTNMSRVFAGAMAFNHDISNWDVSSVIDMSWLFSRAYNFNQNLTTWDVSQVTNMSGIFNYSGLSNANYESILEGWSQLPSLQRGVTFDALQNQFCESEDARQNIVENYNWLITDGGKASFCNEDNDFDGILDHKDSCLDTRPNVIVNDNGCEIIAADAILVYGATPTCPGEANGSISISSELTDYIFNIAVEGPVSTDYNEVSLNENIEVANLTTGLYMVTISIPDILYSQTYGIQINEVGSISGKRESLNTSAKTATYNVAGSYTYIVDINGELKNFSFTSNGKNEIQLSDLSEFNAISITGESDCQGMVTDSFGFSDGIIMFPTITSGEVFIQGYEESSTVLVYDLSGKLVLSKAFSGQGLNSINLQTMETGIYPTVIKSKQHSKTFKIIKK